MGLLEYTMNRTEISKAIEEYIERKGYVVESLEYIWKARYGDKLSANMELSIKKKDVLK